MAQATGRRIKRAIASIGFAGILALTGCTGFWYHKQADNVVYGHTARSIWYAEDRGQAVLAHVAKHCKDLYTFYLPLYGSYSVTVQHIYFQDGKDGAAIGCSHQP